MGKAKTKFRSVGPGQGRIFWPSTTAGRWSIGLFTSSALLVATKVMVPIIALCGLAAGVSALIAIAGKHERSLLVWLPLVIGLMVFLISLAELLVPH